MDKNEILDTIVGVIKVLGLSALLFLGISLYFFFWMLYTLVLLYGAITVGIVLMNQDIAILQLFMPDSFYYNIVFIVAISVATIKLIRLVYDWIKEL
ncbi:MAG: hypothetical protein J7K33_09865 [Candidatus Marinimicrobia bacterium]|nr:hypothetical protein [Candidatus Neomarinimicrobiota bacterium]